MGKRWADRSFRSRVEGVMGRTDLRVRLWDDCPMRHKEHSMCAMYFIEWDSTIERLSFWLAEGMRLDDVIRTGPDLMVHGRERRRPYRMNILSDYLKRNGYRKSGMGPNNLWIKRREKL